MFGNGDCFSAQQYYEEMEGAGVDGVMVARGALIKPWIFTEIKERREWDISATERLEGIRKVSHWSLIFSRHIPELLQSPWYYIDYSPVPNLTPHVTPMKSDLHPSPHIALLQQSLTYSTPNTDSHTGVPTLKESIQPVDSS
jgi:tRNA-dihydrouridine synthase